MRHLTAFCFNCRVIITKYSTVSVLCGMRRRYFLWRNTKIVQILNVLMFCVQLKTCILKALVKYILINYLISKEIVRVDNVIEEISPFNHRNISCSDR